MEKFVQRLLQAGKNWWDAIIALFGGTVSLFDIAIQLIQWGVIKNDWILPISLCVFLIFGIIAILRAEIELKNLKNTLPKIEAVSIPKVENKGFEETIHRDAVGIEFFNNPKPSTSDLTARDVSATIKWLDMNNNTVETNPGRWWFPNDAELPSSQKISVDMPPNGQTRLLQFAIKDPDDINFNAWYRARAGNPREVKLSKKEYTVVITLRDNRALSWSFKYGIKYHNGRWEIKDQLPKRARR